MKDIPMHRKGGRPRSAAPSSRVSGVVPVPHHDRLAQIAIRQGVSVSRLVGRAVMLFLRDDRSGPGGDDIP